MYPPSPRNHLCLVNEQQNSEEVHVGVDAVEEAGWETMGNFFNQNTFW